MARHLERAAIVGVAIGGAVAAASLVSYPVATVLSGIGAAVAALTVQMVLHGRKAPRPWVA